MNSRYRAMLCVITLGMLLCLPAKAHMTEEAAPAAPAAEAAVVAQEHIAHSR